MGSEALSRVPESGHGPFPWGGARRTPPLAFGRKRPFDFLGFSKHFSFKNDIETLIPPCRPLEVAVGGGSKACLGFSPIPLLVLLAGQGGVGLPGLLRWCQRPGTSSEAFHLAVALAGVTWRSPFPRKKAGSLPC